MQSTMSSTPHGLAASLLRWDIFCAVIDNYGDIGVCWRLARQLVAEHGVAVRLWVDDLSRFVQLCPQADPAADTQAVGGVEVRCWHATFDAGVEPAEVVIEAFACEPPASYLVKMAGRVRKPVWINLEYLSAEAWVEDCHLMASPHPRLPLVKHFFFPGFTARTGGLLREHDLLARRDAFVADGRASDAFWHATGFVPPPADVLRVSLFAYRHADVRGLLQAFAGCGRPMLCAIPDGPLLDEAAVFLGRDALRPGDEVVAGSLIVRVLPFVAQPDYDALLWCCDLNFVRGEDSFVRAQWAARPLVWHIYPQAEDVHLGKLDAFMARYVEGLAVDAGTAIARLAHAWNAGDALDAPLAAVLACLPALQAHACSWAARLAAPPGLAARLAEFALDRLQ